MSIVCLFFPKGRTIGDMGTNEINMPYGLCTYKKEARGYCCLVTNLCYSTGDVCKEECKSFADIVEMTTPSLATLPPFPSN